MKHFVTGTDTGVGKTHVTAALVTALRAQGRQARAIKPIETGWDQPTSDAARLAAVSGQSIDQTIWLTLAAPRSPRSAAALEGRTIDVAALARWCDAQDSDPLFVEGAGGWLVPITAGYRMRDLAVAIASSVVVVARAGLGTVNHTLLTLDSIEQRAAITGTILSRLPTDDLDFARDNAAEIASATPSPVAIFPDDLATIVGWFAGSFDDAPTHRGPRITR